MDRHADGKSRHRGPSLDGLPAALFRKRNFSSAYDDLRFSRGFASLEKRRDAARKPTSNNHGENMLGGFWNGRSFTSPELI
jgi:hypothetical protein